MSNPPKCSSGLSLEDQKLVLPGLVDKFVMNLLESKIDNIDTLYNKLRETLANVMIQLLSDGSNSKRIGILMVEIINVTMQGPIKGPILLWSIMEKSNLYEKMEAFISKTFMYTFNNPKDVFSFVQNKDPIEKFISNFFDNLRSPPYNRWYNEKTLGGRKTLHKRKGRRNKKMTYRKKDFMIGGDDTAPPPPSPSDDNNGQAESTFETLDENAANIEKGKAKSDESSQMLTDQNLGAGADYTEEIEMQKKFNKFNKKLLELSTKTLDKNKEEVMEKILAAAWLHAKANNDVLLDSLNESIHNTITDNAILQEAAPIILTQALYMSSDYVSRAIRDAVEELKKDLIASQELKYGEELKFDPTKSEFITTFMSILKLNLKKVIHPSYD